MVRFIRLSVVAGLLLVPAGAIAADDAQTAFALGNNEIYSKSLAALTMLLVLAILLENALAVIFNWRLFLTYFSAKGTRTLIMIAAAWLLVAGLHIDIIASLMDVYLETAVRSGVETQFLTALILAGGSSGVYSIMKVLGYRQDVPQDVIAPKPPPTKAWLAVRTRRVNARGPILVKVKEVTPLPKDVPSPIAGVVGGGRVPLGDIFFRNPNRFPQSGGYTLDANKLYEVTVEGEDGNGQPIVKPDGNRLYVFAPGAIVDLEVNI